MIKKSLKSVILALGAGLVVFLFVFSPHSRVKAADSGPVMAADLQKAGYTQVKPLAPTAAGRFKGPNLYFEVSDKVSAPTSEAPNVVMTEDFILPYQPTESALFNYGADSQAFSVFGGSGKEATMPDGRVAINLIKGYHYVVVIGPNKVKVEALATSMAGKL